MNGSEATAEGGVLEGSRCVGLETWTLCRTRGGVAADMRVYPVSGVSWHWSPGRCFALVVKRGGALVSAVEARAYGLVHEV